jgi:hypothetical protein
MRGSETVRMIGPEGGRFLGVRAEGAFRRFGTGGEKEKPVLRCHGRSCDGRTFDLLVEGGAPVDLTLVGVRTGLPPEGAPLVRARPRTAQPQYIPDSTVAVDRVQL